MRHTILIILAILLCTSLLGGSFLFWQDKFTASLVPPEQKGGSLTLFFAGDIMLDRGVEWHMLQNQDWKWPFLNIAETLRKADLVFGNLESIISEKGVKQGSIYSFRADPRTLEGLISAGFDVVSVANNHSIDYGPDAFVDSLERLKEKGIAPVGGGTNKKEAHTPALFTLKGAIIGILAYTQVGSPFWQAGEQSPGIAWMDKTHLSQLHEDIEKTKSIADLLVVSFHFGEEYQLKPNEIQEVLSRAAIDYGADLVIGHHPHISQPVERYRQGWIAYSLGNFVFDQGFSVETMQGTMLKVSIKEKSITEVTPLKIQLSSTFQPAISKESTK